LAIAEVNDAPTLGDLNLAAVEDTALTMNLLAAATDVDGDTLTASIVATAQHGQVSINAPSAGSGQAVSFTYTPNLNHNGVDSFTYKVNDGSLTGAGLDSNVATVTLSISAVNDAPTLGDLNLAAVEDTPLSMNLLAQAADVDGDALTATIATVTLAVDPVNDAPVAADAAVTTAEDTALVIDLRSYASDIEGTVLTTRPGQHQCRRQMVVSMK
jgi:hypothetical protein